MFRAVRKKRTTAPDEIDDNGRGLPWEVKQPVLVGHGPLILRSETLAHNPVRAMIDDQANLRTLFGREYVPPLATSQRGPEQ